MPVDTLTPGAPAAPALPFRLRTKVPGYLLRRPADGGARKPSAVERLEADKAKYVKSLHVANTRQEPVQPLLSKQPLFSPGTRRTVLTPSRRALPGPGRRPQLDLDILSSLINLCDSPVSPVEASCAPAQAEGVRQAPPATPPRPPPTTAAVRRVDVRPLPASPAQPCCARGRRGRRSGGRAGSAASPSRLGGWPAPPAAGSPGPGPVSAARCGAGRTAVSPRRPNAPAHLPRARPAVGSDGAGRKERPGPRVKRIEVQERKEMGWQRHTCKQAPMIKTQLCLL
uniref:Family with sequence similarity 110 member A n=1 Tax=Oryctolagus cuniculus TaxID=9986 RepID=A0A5F9C0T2_RABIT